MKNRGRDAQLKPLRTTTQAGRQYRAACVVAFKRLLSFPSTLIKTIKYTLPSKGVIFAIAALLVPGSVFLMALTPKATDAATSSTLNFQARLLQSSGSLVADGTYNIQYNLYDVSSGGSSLWTETYLNNVSQGVTLKNGYLSVYLGSLTSFPSTINWDQELWLGMTVRGTGSCSFGACTPTDSEMTPRFKLTALPYSFIAGRSLGVASNNTNATSTHSGNVTITTGNAAGATSNSGNLVIDTGTATGTTGTITIAGTNASGLTLGRSGLTTTNAGAFTAAQLLTGQLGATISGATIALNASSNFATNINTGTSTGAVTIGNSAAGAIALQSASTIGLTGTTTITGLSSGNALVVNNSTSSGNIFVAQDNGTPVFTIADGGDVTLAGGKSLIVTGSGTLPGSPTEGQIYYDSTNNRLMIYQGSQWELLNGTNSSTFVVAASDSVNPYAANYRADGTADNVEIQAAIDAADAAADGTVYLMEGTYNIATTMTMKSGISLVGAGKGTVLKFIDNAADAAMFDWGSGSVSNAVFANFRINGNRANNVGRTNQTGISLYNTDNSNIFIQNIRAFDLNRYGIEMLAMSKIVVKDNYVSGSGGGIYVSGNSNRVEGNRVIDSDGTGMQIFGDYSVVDNNIVINAPGIGMHVTGNNMSITGNKITDSGDSDSAMRVGTTDSIFSNNNIYSNNGTGIFEYNSGQYNKYIGNSITGNVRGMDISYHNDVITGNTFRSNTGDAIYLAANSAQISNNYFYDNAGSGSGSSIAIVGGDNITISGNRIIDTAGSGYAINISSSGSDNTVLSGNTFSGTGATTMNDSGTGTVYSGQSTVAGGLSTLFRQTASTTAFQIQNASGNGIITVDTTNGELEIGSSSTAGKIVISDGSSNTGTIQTASLGSDEVYILPDSDGSDTICLLDLANCGGGGGDSISVNGSGATDANFINTAASGTVTGTTFTLDTGPSPDTITLTIGNASDTVAGAVTTGTQTFGGAKTFNSLITGQAGLTISGAAVSLNNNSNFNTSINTGTSTGTVTIGNSAAGAIALQSASTITVTSGSTTTISGHTSGSADALVVSNSTSTGSIFVAKDDTTAVVTVANGGAATFQNSTDSTAGFKVMDANGGTSVFVVDTDNERVGIGTDSPGAILDIGGGSTYINTLQSGGLLTTDKGIQIRHTDQSYLNLVSDLNADDAVLGGVYFTRSAGQADSHGQVAGILGVQSGTGVLAGGELQFYTKTNGSGPSTNRMTISQDGYVGIGIAPGSALLGVNGSIALGTSNSFSGAKVTTSGTDASGNAVAITNTTGGTGRTFSFASNNSGSLVLSDASLATQRLIVDNNGNFVLGADTTPTARLLIDGTADDQQLIVQAHSSQTNDLLQLQDSSSNVNAAFSANGSQLSLGRASNVTGSALFRNASGSGSIAIQANNPGSSTYTLNLPAENGTLCSTGSVCSGYQASGSYANTALSNLSSVAINTHLLPGTDDAVDLGDNTHRFRDLFLGGETIHLGTSTSDEATLGYTTSSNTFTLQSTVSGGDIDIDANDAITIDGASLSLDATTSSNLTVTGSAQNLTLSAAGGGAQVLAVSSAGTGANALDFDSTGTGGGMTFNTSDGAIVLTAAGASNGDITLSPTDDFTLNGTAGSVLNIGTSSVTQTINIGNASNTDLALNDANWSVTGAGTATFADIVCNSASCISTGEITTDTIDWTDIADSTTLDDPTTISYSATANGIGLDLAVTNASNQTSVIGFEVTPTFTLDAADVSLYGININPNTNSNNDAGDTLAGLNIAAITGSSAAEYGIQIGSGWDRNIFINDSTASVGIPNDGQLVVTNANGNNLFFISDVSTVGVATTPMLTVILSADVDGTLNVDGALTLSSYAGNNAVLYAAPSTGEVTAATTSTGSLCLLSDGGGTDLPGWSSCPGGGSLTVRESDASPSVGSVSTLEFGPASTSSEEFIVADQTGGVVRVTIGTQVAKLNEAESVTGGWTFGTGATVFNSGTTFNTDVDFTLAGSENIGITHDLAGTINVMNLVGTPHGSANTAYGLYIDQADSANANGFDASIVIDNSDTSGAAIADGILFVNAGSGFTRGITFAGATTDVTTTGSETLTIAPGGTGDLVLSTANTGAAALDINVTGSGGDLDIDVNDAITIDSVSFSIDSTNPSNLTLTSDGAADDLTVAVAGATDSSLILSSSGTGADALQITTTAGGLDISVAGNAAGEDLDIVATGAATEIRISTASTVADAFRLDASAGGIDIDAAGAVDIHGSTGVALSSVSDIDIGAGAAVDILASATSSLRVSANSQSLTVAVLGGGAQELILSSAGTGTAAINIDVTGSGGDLDIDVNDAITIDSASFSIDGTATSNLTVTGSAQNLTVATAGGGAQVLAVSSAGTGTNALDLDATAGGVTIDAVTALSIDVTSATSASNISVVASADAEDLTIAVTGSAGDLIFSSADQMTLDAVLLSLDATTSSNYTVTGSAQNLTLAVAGGGAQELILSSAGTGTAAINIDATGSGGDIDIDANDAITIDSTSFSIDSTNPSNITLTSNAAADDFTIALAGLTDSSLIISSTGTTADALQITATQGGIDILAQGNIAGEDLDITATDAATINVTAASSDAAALDFDATAGGITIDAATVLSIDVTAATAASNISVAANADAEDLTIAVTGSAGDLFLSSVDQLTLDAGSATSIILADYITDANGVLYTSTTGVLTRVAETETGSLCLLSGAGSSGVPTWNTCPGGGGYATIQDEGGALTTRTILNFTGAGVTCVDNGGSTRTDCTIAGGSGADLQGTYDTGAAGDQIITLDGSQDSIVIRNPSSSGSDSAFVFKTEQLNTGVAKIGLYVDNRGTGNSFQVDDVSSDTTPFIVDADGRVGIGTAAVSGTTERLLQVGSATNRGNAAVFGELISKGLSDINALSNIRDTYIYDTSLDSDGGRWIEWSDTERLSWATETLDDGASDPCDISTDDRCYSTTFPRKAILVVTTSALYIFDSSTGTMWMKFNQNASGYALGVDTSNDPSSVTALNGVIYVGTNGGSAGGLYALDFVNDRMWNFDDTDRSGADVGIGSRNAAVTYNSDNNTRFDLGGNTGWKTINDVSATVVQNSQTLPSTTQGGNNAITAVGLATDSGLSVINLSTQIVRSYSDQTDNDYNAVVVTRNARLYGLNSALDQLELWLNIDVDNFATQVNGAPTKVVDETTAPRLSATTPVVNTNAPDALEVIPNQSLADSGILATTTIPSNSDLIYVGTDQGLTELHMHNYTNSTTFSGWSKFYTVSKQTALMPGTVRRMHTMDDASGDVTNAAQTDIMEAKGTPTYNVDGVRNRAMSFNGTSQYLCSDANNDATCDTDSSDDINTGSFTITAWFKHAATASGVDTLFARCYTTTPAAATGCIAAAMNASGQMVTTVDDDTGWSIGAATNNDVTYTSTNSYADNQWHFYSLSKINGNVAPVVMIDGQVISYATALNHTTLSGSQILGIGSDCSTGAACGTGGNFWDGAIDDFTYSACGSAACATDGMGTTAANAAIAGRLLYNDARSALNKKVYDGAADTTSYTSTVITDSSTPGWIPNEFAGMIVRINSGSGAGQTRRITANTTSTITVYPAFSTTPASNDDFKVDPESLVGSSNNVKAIGVTKNAAFGESRIMCAGTNSGGDAGAVTCFNHQSGPNIVADTYHGDSEYFDEAGAEWTGTGYDDIQSLDLTPRTLIIGSAAHMWTETQDVRLGNALDYLQSRFNDLRNQIQIMGTTTLPGQVGLGVGLTGGVDLAEYYTSSESLEAGNVVALEANNVGAVKRTTSHYEKGMVGIVATAPGAILGTNDDGQSYPVALVGRVPVKVTTENGEIKAGDRITSSSTPGYGMKAINGGQVVGEALDDLSEDKLKDCPEGTTEGVLCGEITVFVNLTDFNGENVEIAMTEAEDSGMLWGDSFLMPTEGLVSLGDQLSEELAAAKKAQLEKSDKILRYLAGRSTEGGSEVLAARVSANDINGVNVNAGNIYAGTLVVDKLRANQIEGLSVFTDTISSLAAKYNSQTDHGINEEGDQIASAIDLTNFAVRSMAVGQDMHVNGKLYANGGLEVSGDVEFLGNALFRRLVTFIEKTIFRNDVTFEGHIITAGEIPEAVVGVAAGDDQIDNSTADSPRVKLEGNDTAGWLEVVTETGSATGELFSVEFKKPFEKAPRVMITPANGSAAPIRYYVEATPQGFKLFVTDVPAVDTMLKFNYWTIQ